MYFVIQWNIMSHYDYISVHCKEWALTTFFNILFNVYIIL
jgi:hypothetical protein